MGKVVTLTKFKFSKMSPIERLKYELEINSNILFGHEYFIIDDDELFRYTVIKGRKTGLHVFYLPECTNIVVKKDSITLLENECKVTLSKKGVSY